MADLFTNAELVSFMQVDELPNDIIDLARELTTAEIRNYIGTGKYALLTADEFADLKGVALQVSKRVIFNPEGLRSEEVDDYSYTIAVENLAPPNLTTAEEKRIDRVIGVSGAFSIAPSYPSPTYNRVERVYRAPGAYGYPC
jgi:hypothetical protein